MAFAPRTDIRDPTGYPRQATVVLVRPDGYIAAVGTDPESLADAVLPTTGSVDAARIADQVGTG